MMQELVQLDHRRMRLLESLFEENLSRVDFSVMDTIYRYREEHPDIPGIYASEIAERFRISRPAVSRHLQCLEDRGWIYRTVDPRSRRSVFIALTNSGSEVLLRQYERGKAFHDNVFHRMGDGQMQMLLDGMRRLTEAMEQEVERMKQEKGTKGEHT